MNLKEYIREEVAVLKDLQLWKYCSDYEKKKLHNAQSESEVVRLMRTYRDKYYDIMCEDYEKSIEPPQFNVATSSVDVRSLNFSNRTKGGLLRNRILTLREFEDFVMQHGWNKLKGFGSTAATEVIAKTTNLDGTELTAMVEKMRLPQKYKM